MITTTQLIAEEKASSILEALCCVKDCYFMDRARHLKNYGLDGSVGSYKSAFDLPHNIIDELRSLAPPKVGPEELDVVFVNKYDKGSWLPKHRDKTLHTTMSLLFLGRGSYLKFYFDDKVTKVDEKPGMMITAKTNLIHEVTEIDKERYVVLFMYR